MSCPVLLIIPEEEVHRGMHALILCQVEQKGFDGCPYACTSEQITVNDQRNEEATKLKTWGGRNGERVAVIK